MATLGALFGTVLVELSVLSCLSVRQYDETRLRGDVRLRIEIQELVDQQSWYEVVDLADRARESGDADILLDVGFACRQLGRIEEAQDFYRQAMELRPNDVRPHYEMARLYETTGRRREAESEYRRALEIDDALPDVHFAYGLLQIKMNSSRLAISHMGRAVDLYPDSHPNRAAAQSLIRQLASEGTLGK